MYKQLFLLSAACFLWQQQSIAQNKGMLPITGMRYIKEGIWAKTIAVKINGEQLYGNRIPWNKEIEISLQEPTGFTADKKKIVYAGAEFNLFSAKGELLLKNPNLFLLKETTGFAPKDFKTLSLKIGIPEGLIQPNSKGVVRIRVYDLKGKNQLTLDYPIVIAYPRENIPFTKSIIPLVSPPGSIAMVTGMKAKNLAVSIDTMVSTNPKMAYLKLEISKIDGTDLVGLLQGKETFWVYDSEYNEIKMKDILLKQVGGNLEGGNVNCMLKIPFHLKTAPPNGYFVRYRWESQDKTQVMDIVVAK